MPLFVCDECHCIENTALGQYYSRKFSSDPRPLCSEHAPEDSVVKEPGEWHGRYDGILTNCPAYLLNEHGETIETIRG